MTDAPLMVCGRFSLYVSGSLGDIIPEKIIGTPLISMGNGRLKILAKGLKKGARTRKKFFYYCSYC